MFEQILTAIENHGLLYVLIAGTGLFIVWNYKSIVEWLWTTIQAAAIVKSHEATIEDLRAEIHELRLKLEDYNKMLMNHTATIARLEERIIQSAKNRVKDKYEESNN